MGIFNMSGEINRETLNLGFSAWFDGFGRFGRLIELKPMKQLPDLDIAKVREFGTGVTTEIPHIQRGTVFTITRREFGGMATFPEINYYLGKSNDATKMPFNDVIMKDIEAVLKGMNESKKSLKLLESVRNLETTEDQLDKLGSMEKINKAFQKLQTQRNPRRDEDRGG